MQRYVFTAISIGAGVALLIIVAVVCGAFSASAAWLEELYVSRGLLKVSAVIRFLWMEMLVVLAVSIGVAWCVIDLAQVAQKILVCGCAALLLLGLSWTLALYGVLFEPFSALGAGLLAAAGGFVFAGTERGMRKRLLQDVLGLRVSHATFNQLLEADEPPEFEAGVENVTVLTCRIFNYAELSEKIEAADLMKMSNLFLRTVSTFLTSRGAYLDESGPGLVRAFFGMVQSDEKHAEEACRAALELRSQLKTLNQECENRWNQPLCCGVGISSGPLAVGVYGSRGHYYYSGIGAETDFSSRLARANFRYRSDLLVGPETYRLVEGSFEFRPMEMFYDPEADVMTEIYQLLASSGSLDAKEAERRDLYWQGGIYFREQKYEKALGHLTRARAGGRIDGPVEFFIAKTQDALVALEGGSKSREEQLTEEGHARLSNLM